MKALKFLAVCLIAFTFSGKGILSAQPKMENEMKGDHKAMMHKEHEPGFGMMIPNLSDDQKNKIKDLRLAHFKEIKPLINQMGELRAREKTLTTADKPDMKAIDANIDKITTLQNQIMKTRENHRQQVRALLTDEQRIFFDMHKGEMMHGKMKMMKHENSEHFEGLQEDHDVNPFMEQEN